MATPPSSGPRPSSGGWFFGAIGLAVLLVIAYQVVRSFLPVAPSHGPPAAEALDLTLAPGLEVEILPSHGDLAGVRFQAFDVSRDGAVLVHTGHRLVDLTGGEDVLPGGRAPGSFAFQGEGLAVVDGDNQIRHLQAGVYELVGPAPVPSARLAPASDGAGLYVVRGSRDPDGAVPAIVLVREDAAAEALTGSYAPVRAVGGDGAQTVYAVGHALYQVVHPGSPSLLLALPEASGDILGVAVSEGAVYFATARAIYALGDGLAVPLVLGLGGDLRAVGSALYVLGAEHGRVYRVTLRGGGDR